MAAPEDWKLKSDLACQAAEQFAKLFYETYDKRRHVINKFYLDTASLVWNGNAVNGKDAILQYLEGLPSSEHTLECLDAQPIASQVTQGQTSIMVTTTGVVKYQGNKTKLFNETFMLTSQNNSWKVVSDCVRMVE